MTENQTEDREHEYMSLARHLNAAMHAFLVAEYGQDAPVGIVLAGVGLFHEGCIRATLRSASLSSEARLESVADALAGFTHNVVWLLGKHR